MKKILLTTVFLFVVYLLNAQWIEQASGFATASRGIDDISIVDMNIVWATAYDGSGGTANVQEFTKTIDGGTTWTPGTIDIGDVTLGIAMLHAYDVDTAWLAAFINSSGNQGIYITKDGGATWTRQTTASYTNGSSFTNVVHFWDDGLNGFCQGDPINGEFENYITTDGGENWALVDGTNIADPLTGEWGYTGVYASAGHSVWYGTNKGRLYHSVDSGQTWAAYQTPIADFDGQNVAFKDDNNGLIVDENGIVYSTSDAGANWSTVAITGEAYSAGLCFVEGTDFAVSTGSATGASGSSYTFDGGTTWVNIDTTIQHLDVEFLDISTGWSGGFNTDATAGGMFKYSGTLTKVFNEIIEHPEMVVYPNPSNNVVNVISNEISVDLFVYDITGKIVYHTVTNNKNSVIDINNFDKGTYVISLNGVNEKLIVY